MEIEKTINIRKNDIKRRTVVQDYICCPHCGDEIDDTDATLVGDIEISCPHCGGNIYIGK